MSNIRHAKYDYAGRQIDDPNGAFAPVEYDNQTQGVSQAALVVDKKAVQGGTATNGNTDSSALNQSLSLKANLDAYNRSSHTGPDNPYLNEQNGSSYTLGLNDFVPNAVVRMNTAVANTVFVPSYSSVPIAPGLRVPVDQYGTGVTRIAPQDGTVVLRSALSLQVRAQYSRIWIEKQALNEWIITGDLAASGAPVNRIPASISGGPAVGATLTRVAGTWDGSPAPTITGQWYQLIPGSPAVITPISGQTGSSYVTTGQTAGYGIFYRETASNGVGSAVVADSNIILLTAAAATTPQNSVLPVITGTAVVPNALSVNNGTWSNSPSSYSYQWVRFPGTANQVNISGATSNNYTLTSSDAGTTIGCIVTATNASGSTSVTTLGTSVSGAPATPVSSATGSSFPAIYDPTNNYVTGSILYVDVGAWNNNPTFTYQWQESDGTNNPTPISGAIGSSYAVVGTDAGKIISCLVTGTTTGGATTVATTGIYIGTSTGLPVNSVAPVVSGTATVGSQLSTTNGTWTNSPTFAYNWYRITSGTATLISGATSNTYTLQAADAGLIVYCIVTATANGLNGAASSNQITVSGSTSGSISLVQSNPTSFTISTDNTIDWLIYPNSTTAIAKNGVGLITKTDIGTLAAASGTNFVTIAYTGGNSPASGTDTSYGLNNATYGSTGVGASFTVPLNGTTPTVFDVYVQAYNCKLNVNASLSDGSGAFTQVQLDSGNGGGLAFTRLRFTANAASAGKTFTVSVVTNSTNDYSGGGQITIRGAGIVSR